MNYDSVLVHGRRIMQSQKHDMLSVLQIKTQEIYHVD